MENLLVDVFEPDTDRAPEVAGEQEGWIALDGLPELLGICLGGELGVMSQHLLLIQAVSFDHQLVQDSWLQ